jgi:hypothetical protein
VSAVKTTPKLRRLQGENASAIRWNHPKKDEIARAYAEERLVDFISKVVAEAPPLTDAQRDRIASILRGGGMG